MEPPGSCNMEDSLSSIFPVQEKSVPTISFPGNAEKLESAAIQLKTDIEQLTQRYQADLNARLESWARPRNGERSLPAATVAGPDNNFIVKPDTRSLAHGYSAAFNPALPNGDKCPKHTATQGFRDGLSTKLGENTKKQSKAKKRVSDFLLAEDRADAVAHLTPLQRFTSHSYYEVFSVCLIFSNAMFIGWECQHMAERAQDDAAKGLQPREDAPTLFVVLGFLFTILFVVELALRWIADGLIQFFQTADFFWNLFDVVIVGFGLLDIILEIVMEVSSEPGEAKPERVTSNVSVIRVLRVVRIVRVAKVIRVMRFFRELRIMLYSIIGSLKSLLWVMLILGMMFYVFGICFTVAATIKLTAETRTLPLFVYFGTLDRSLLSLYMSMSGGNDWGLYYDALMDLDLHYRLIFLLFISFSVFAVVNIVTGVFVDTAFKGDAMDRQVVVMEELENKKTYLSSMRSIFEEMDTDSTGVLSLEEFERRLDDERVVAYFNALKLDVSDARTLFTLLDYDQSEEVSVDEFLTGCYKLQGESRSLDMKIMQCEVRYLKESICKVVETVDLIHSALLPTDESQPDIATVSGTKLSSQKISD